MIKLKVTGMTCGHCEKAATNALSDVAGVDRVVDVSRERGEAVVEGTVETEALLAALREEGYEVEVAR